MPVSAPVPAYLSYPKAGSVIKPSKRNFNAIHLAASMVAGTQEHKGGVLVLGGSPAVAAAILAAIPLTPECTVAKVIQRTMIVLAQPQSSALSARQTDALYAILVLLV